ncbi:hypothetical protein BGX27_010506 [Mortierella sp. AM989]|nr:hypothetical protein BGX27_010506 [Mortierella sp. AM989]
MSVNWVLLTPDGKDIVPLENETIFFREQGVRIELDCSNGGYPGAGALYASKSGTLLLTNQRIVYLCAEPTTFFASASIPMSNIHDAKLVQSWFSAPVFKAVAMPVPGGGLSQPARLSITFSSKSTQTIHEFDVQYRSLRERIQESDGAAPQHLEQLPMYLPPSDPVPELSTPTDATPTPTSSTTSAPTPQPQPYPTPYHVHSSALSATTPISPPPPQPLPQAQHQAVPTDLPPSYDELR